MKAAILYSLSDLPTTITAVGGDAIAKDLASMGVQVVQLDVWKCINPVLQLQDWMNKPDLIVYLGHGANDRLYGQLPMGLAVPLVQVLTAYLLSGTITVAYACDCGQALGPASPSRAFFGATQPFSVALTYPEHDYMSDFIDTWKVIPEALVKGITTGDALSLYVARCTQYINLYAQHSTDWSEAPTYQQFLTQNRDSYRLFGDAGATV